MNKDVIYIDVEDDITAIIGKVKDAKSKIVALVPPKRVGVLQSSVNMQLLVRAASQSEKRLVVITNNPALIALAAAAKLPVAKNLQSKPEVAEIAALDIDDGEDVIDGAQLPVGEHARTAGGAALAPPHVEVRDSAIESALNENAAEENLTRAKPPAPGELPNKPKSKSGIKVPNFNDFRKRLILIIAAGVLLVGFLVWAIFFAARATVLITARTSDSSVNNNVTLADDVETSVATKSLQSVTAETKKSASVEFEATGKKDVGEKATGTVEFSTDSISALGTTIPAGTVLTSSDAMQYVTDSSVTMTIANSSGAPVTITAVDSGTDSNGASGSMSGSPSGISATLDGTTSGGTDKTVTIVTQSDVQKATEQLKQTDVAEVKKELAEQLGDDVIVVEQAFKASEATPAASPAVGEEVASGTKPKLTSEVTYTLSGIDKNEMNDYLNSHFEEQLEGLNDQRVYENGAPGVTFTNVNPVENGYTANLVATAQIGPKIEDSAVKEIAKGKRYGEIQSSIEKIQGVEDVDIKFWPFWVSTAPNDVKKITVEFKLNES